MRKFPWTPEEDAILRSTSSQKEAERRLPNRSYAAIESRRRYFALSSPPRFWTKAEDRTLRKYAHESPKRLASRLKGGRSFSSIFNRRLLLGCTRPPTGKRWFAREVRILETLWPKGSRNELLAALPRHHWSSIEARAAKCFLPRWTRSSIRTDSLCGQIRQRAREDGISLLKLSLEIGVGRTYFSKPPKTANYEKVAKAVEFFGGRLVIDWQDE